MIDVHLGPIPKIDRVELMRVLFISVAYDKVNWLPTVKRIPDALWNEAKLLISFNRKTK